LIKRIGLTAALGIAVALSATPARAQGTDELGAYGGLEHRRHQHSPQDWAFEVRFGQYPPRVDNGLAGTPYKNIFGTKKRWQGGAELDWQAFRIPRRDSSAWARDSGSPTRVPAPAHRSQVVAVSRRRTRPSTFCRSSWSGC
jgi:hypothetical protein